jgi:hypothetical protein
MAAEVSYMRAQPVVVPPLPSAARWLARIQVVLILISSIANLVLARWHLRYFLAYRRATSVKKFVYVGLFSFTVLIIHFLVFYVVALVNAV